MEEAAEGTSEFSEKACSGGSEMPAMTVVSGVEVQGHILPLPARRDPGLAVLPFLSAVARSLLQRLQLVLGSVVEDVTMSSS